MHGFSYYHYWFGGEGGHNKSVMWKVPYQVLHDGQPNLPYFFTWANEPWTRKFSGQAGEARKKGREGKRGGGAGREGGSGIAFCALCFQGLGFRV